MNSITKEYDFIAAHRIEQHPKCGRLHGHNYKVEVTIGWPMAVSTVTLGSMLNQHGFIIDFAALSAIVKPILEQLDHRYIVSTENTRRECPYVTAAQESGRLDDLVFLDIHQSSVELLGEWLKFEIAMALHEHGYRELAVLEVKLWETPKAYAIC